MKLIILLFTILAIVACKPKNNEQAVAETSEDVFTPFVQKMNDQLDELIEPSATVEIISEGYEWSEGPIWIDGLGLLFSDIPPNRIFIWNEDSGTRLFLTPSGYTGTEKRGGEVGSNGLLLNKQNELVLCQHGDRRIAIMQATLNDPKPEYETIVDNYQGKKLNSPNDACYNQSGDLYFTDPPYGLEKNIDDPLKELEYQGVYKYSISGEMTLLTNKMTRPNGIAFSPDEKTLYVANSDPKRAIWMEYNLDDKGLIKSEKVFYDATSFVGKDVGLPDGLKVGSNGNIYATGPGGVWIFNSNGTVLGKIRTGQATSNCAIGNQGKMLYITADMYVMRIALRG